jgi:hypothetical protein
MILALFVVGLLLVAGFVLMSNSQFSAADTVNSEQKDQAFNAAEAGDSTAIESLDLNSGSTSGSGTLANGATYQYTITNNLASGSALPISGRGSLPAYSALISSKGWGALAGRPVTVESVVTPATSTITFPNDAIDAGLDIQGNWNSGNCIGISGSAPSNNNANIHANHNITANTCFTDGQASASGTVSGNVNATGGTVNGVPQVPLPTAQMATFVSNEKTIAQSSPPLYPYDYIASGGSLPSTYACPVTAPSTGCVVFVDSSLSMAGHSSASFTGRVTVVVNGDFSATGQAALSFQTGKQSVLVVNGNADVGGNGSAAALVWAKGDITLHGNGNLDGAAVAGGNVNFLGGGNGGGFTYDSTLINVTLGQQGKLTIATFGEY